LQLETFEPSFDRSITEIAAAMLEGVSVDEALSFADEMRAAIIEAAAARATPVGSARNGH
jgi:ribosomal protein L12E/L44/L45/RPP1/RPP2